MFVWSKKKEKKEIKWVWEVPGGDSDGTLRHDQVYMCACIVSPVRTGLFLQVPLIFKPLISSRLYIDPARIPGRWRSHWQISIEGGYGHLSSVRTCGHGRPKFFFRLDIMVHGKPNSNSSSWEIWQTRIFSKSFSIPKRALNLKNIDSSSIDSFFSCKKYVSA